MTAKHMRELLEAGTALAAALQLASTAHPKAEGCVPEYRDTAHPGCPACAALAKWAKAHAAVAREFPL